MQEFFKNVVRYPTYLVALILGIFIALFDKIKPLFKNPVTATALVGATIGILGFTYFTLRAMLGLN
jgi:Protein of unknown function (DUF751)